MRPTKVKPAPGSTNSPKQNSRGSGVWDSSSAKGSPVPESSPRSSLVFDPSSPKGPPVRHSSSTRSTLLPNLSSPKGPPVLNPSSFRNSLLPDPSGPRGAPVPDPSSPRGLTASCSSTFGSFLVPEPFPPQPPTSQNIQLSSDSLGRDSLLLSGSLHQIPPNGKDHVLEIHVPVTKARELRSDDATLNWRFAALALLLICILLLTMVSLMGVKVNELEWRSKEEIKVMQLQILVLSETLKELQLGKVWTCTVCKVRWVQQADLCFLFSDLRASWQISKSVCLEESSALAVMETKEEMDFLRDESSKYFDIVYHKYQYHQFWIGLKYDNSSSLVLRDGTLLPLQVSAKVGPHPCIYLQKGSLFTEPCQTKYYFICKTEVQFGWK